MDHFDVVIVGGAAVGSAAAYFLAAHPQFDGRLLVLEQDFSYQRCATTLSVASVRHQFSTPENIRMSMFGSEFIRRGSASSWRWTARRRTWAGTRPATCSWPAQAGLPALQANHRLQNRPLLERNVV